MRVMSDQFRWESESLITWAAITLMTRCITRRSSRRSGQTASRDVQRD